jgi:hypothetical protein
LLLVGCGGAISILPGDDNLSLYRFQRHESATAIYVLALMVALFGVFTQVATCAGMGGCSAKRAMHHIDIPFLISQLPR